MRKFLGLILVYGLLSLQTASAALPDSQTAVNAIEAYLNSVHTLKARFLQTSADGKQLAGDFSLKRPGKMRFDYDEPVKDFIVADGIFVYYYDGKLKEQSQALISQSLADFFLRKDIKLSGDIKVTDIQRDGTLLQVSLVQASDPAAGTLTLGLAENPMQLRKWRVVDATGATTEIELFETVEGIKLDNDLFHFYDPNRKSPKYN